MLRRFITSKIILAKFRCRYFRIWLPPTWRAWPIPIQNFPKIPKITLRTVCDHSNNTKTLPEDKYLKKKTLFSQDQHNPRDLVQSPYLKQWSGIFIRNPLVSPGSETRGVFLTLIPLISMLNFPKISKIALRKFSELCYDLWRSKRDFRVKLTFIWMALHIG